MNKKLVSAILCGAMVLAAATPVMADGGVADGKKIALVGKSAGNAFFEIAANSFKETVETLFIRKQQQLMLRSKFWIT